MSDHLFFGKVLLKTEAGFDLILVQQVFLPSPVLSVRSATSRGKFKFVFLCTCIIKCSQVEYVEVAKSNYELYVWEHSAVLMFIDVMVFDGCCS